MKMEELDLNNNNDKLAKYFIENANCNVDELLLTRRYSNEVIEISHDNGFRYLEFSIAYSNELNISFSIIYDDDKDNTIYKTYDNVDECIEKWNELYNVEE